MVSPTFMGRGFFLVSYFVYVNLIHAVLGLGGEADELCVILFVMCVDVVPE